jgi:hypothetical protein
VAKKAPTKAESAYMGKVAALGCIIEGNPAQVHHIREGQGLSQRASHYLVIPLCPECHMGALSIHKTKRQFENIHGSELDLLAETIRRLASDN